MTLYLTIITTALVITQILRLVQNAKQLKYLHNKADKEYEMLMAADKILNRVDAIMYSMNEVIRLIKEGRQ